MDDSSGFADSLGPYKIIRIHDPAFGLRAALVVDNVAAGPSIGGLRMAPDVSISECFRLARAMTLKNAAAGLPHGGGKSVLWGDPRMPAEEKEQLVRAFARAIRSETDYIVGPDMGTDETCMAWVHDEIGRAVGLPKVLGGIPLDEIGATGWGLRHAVVAAAERSGLTLDGARLAVQGFGAVGRHVASFLGALGVRLVGVADSGGCLEDPRGLDLGELRALKAAGQSVTTGRGQRSADPNAIVRVDCDIWIPAARPDVLHADNAASLRAKIVAQGANVPCTAEADRILHERGVVNLPDFIANAGGVICAAVEHRGGTQRQAFEEIETKIGENTRLVLERAAQSHRTLRSEAEDLATERVGAAMKLRRQMRRSLLVA